MATRKADALARVMDAERIRLENTGLRAVLPAARRMRVEVIRAYKTGNDPSASIAKALERVNESLRNGMVAADLQARLRSAVNARTARGGLRLSAYDEAVRLLTDRLLVSQSDLNTLSARYAGIAQSVTGELGTMLEREVQSAIAESVRQGLGSRDGALAIRQAFDSAGVTPDNPYLFETLYRTQLQTAYSAGRWQANEDPAIQEILWGYEYAAVMDDRTTDLCSELDGQRHPKGDRFWSRFTPPNHWNSVAEGTQITTRRGVRQIEDVEVGDYVMTHRGRWRRVYASMNKVPDTRSINAVHLSTGRILRVTDEHPVLTSDGWKPARDIKAGDVLYQHVEQASRSVEMRLRDPNDHPPARHEPIVPYDVTRTTRRAGVVLAVDLKDGHVTREREVGDVSANRVLERILGVAKAQYLNHLRLALAWLVSPSVAARGRCPFLHAAHTHWVVACHAISRVVSSLSPAPVILAGSLGYNRRVSTSDCGLSGLCAYGLSDPLANGADGVLAHAVPSFNLTKRKALAPVQTSDEFDHGVGVMESRHGEWAPATVVSIVAEESPKQVWNLAVEEDETYVAEGVIVHNCRSQIIEVFVGDRLASPTALPSVQPADGFDFNPGTAFPRVAA